MELRSIPRESIVRDLNDNSRLVFKDCDMLELMNSIQEQGLLHPIGVKPEGGNYRIVYGNRRLVALTKLAWAKIPCVILDEDMDETRMKLMNIVENIHRTNPSLYEIGRYLDDLKKKHDLSDKEIAIQTGMTKSRVFQALRAFVYLPPSYRNKVRPDQPGKPRRGHVSPTLATNVINVAKTYNLSNKHMEDILDYFRNSRTISPERLRVLAVFMVKGYSIEEAISELDGIKPVKLTVMMPVKIIETLEKKHGKFVSQILEATLAAIPELKIMTRADLRENDQMLKRMSKPKLTKSLHS